MMTSKQIKNGLRDAFLVRPTVLLNILRQYSPALDISRVKGVNPELYDKMVKQSSLLTDSRYARKTVAFSTYTVNLSLKGAGYMALAINPAPFKDTFVAYAKMTFRFSCVT